MTKAKSFYSITLWSQPQGLLLRFIFVGIINSLFGYSCFALLLYLGMHYSVALLLATMAGIVFNFKTTGSLVFNSHSSRLIGRFIISYAIVYGINLGAIKLLDSLGFSPYLGGALLLVPTALLSFTLQRRFVFHYV